MARYSKKVTPAVDNSIDLGTVVMHIPAEQLPTPVTQLYTEDDVPTVGVKLLSSSAKLPEYATEDSACFDLACDLIVGNTVTVYFGDNIKMTKAVTCLASENTAYIILDAGERALLPTNVIFDIPRGWKILLYPRSGLGIKRHLNLANCVGVVDSDYVDPTYILLVNNTSMRQIIKHGDRVAQGELVPAYKTRFYSVDGVIEQKTSRSGGFGHTGT